MCFPGHHSWGVGFPGQLGLLVHREALGCRMLCPNPRGAGCQAGTRLLGKPQQVVLAPLESVGVLCLLPRYKQCQRKCQVWNCWSSTWERIANSTQTTHGRGSTALAQLSTGSSTHRAYPALSAWANHSHRETMPRLSHSDHGLVGRSSMSCSRRSVCCLLHQIVQELEAAELMEADKVRAFGYQQ